MILSICFFFSKNKKYYFEQQLEPTKEVSLKRYKYGLHSDWVDGVGSQSVYNTDKMEDSFVNPKMRNKRCVWNVNPKPYKGAHFAVFPEELVETPIQAGCPMEICDKCKTPRTTITTTTTTNRTALNSEGNGELANSKRFGDVNDCRNKIK